MPVLRSFPSISGNFFGCAICWLCYMLLLSFLAFLRMFYQELLVCVLPVTVTQPACNLTAQHFVFGFLFPPCVLTEHQKTMHSVNTIGPTYPFSHPENQTFSGWKHLIKATVEDQKTESSCAKNWVSTGALEALGAAGGPSKVRANFPVSSNNTCHSSCSLSSQDPQSAWEKPISFL